MSSHRLSFAAPAAALLVAAATLLAGCERPPIQTEQHGYRGLGMERVDNPRTLATQVALNTAPDPLPAAAQDGPRAREVFQNVKVLGELSVGEFTRTMTAMAAWVAPQQGCAYCHNLQNLADDGLYTKVVARRMLEMTRHINSDWSPHVAATGVTCYTCHRGNNIPQKVWFRAVTPRDNGFIGNRAGQNAPSVAVAYASLPNDPFSAYLEGSAEIRVAATAALPGNPRHSIAQTESSYGLMMHISQALGVNCTFCHNTQAFANWSESTPQRVTAWHGIRMARDLNNAYMTPLTATFPAQRLGPSGDVAKVSCATCHQGANKPLYGAQMLKDYPALKGAPAAAMPAASAADAAAPAAPAASAPVLTAMAK